MGTRNIIIGLILLAIGCATVAPGTLTRTIRKNDDQRAYQACIQQNVRNTADLRRHCKRISYLRWANWAWEDCVNEGVLACGHRPRLTDIP